MATSMTPVRAIPTTSADISGSFTASGTRIRLCAALTGAGEDTLTLLRRQPSGYWMATEHELVLKRSANDFVGASGAIEVDIGSLDKFHVLSATGSAVSAGSVTLEDLTPATGIALPSISGDTLALLAASQSLSNKTIVTPTISTGLAATGSASNDFSGSTGAFKTSTGAVTIGGGNAAIGITSSGAAITITGGAASTWSTSSGALTVSGAGGANFQYNGTTVVDVGVTNSAKVTLAANKSLAGAAGTGALEFGSMTGDTALPTGAVSWAGASGKALSLVATGAALTLTGAAASTWSTSSGALTITSAVAATWSTAAGALTVDSAAALNLGTGDSTSQSIGKSGTIATFNGKVAYGASAQAITDPGNAGAIPVTANGVCNLTSAGAETRTLAIPTFVGQRLTLCLDTDGGDCVVTVASAFNQAGNTTITLNDAGDTINLVGATIGGSRRWRIVNNDGCTLG